MKQQKFAVLSIAFFLFLNVSIAQVDPLLTSDSLAQKAWVNTTYDSMSLSEKIGQLFMVSVASDQSKTATDKIKAQIKNYHLGGVIFSKGGPARQARLTNDYQSVAKIPLLIGQDAEWGLAMRLDSTFSYPWNMTLGAIQKDSIVKAVGRSIGKHAKRIGVNINFAPDLDINNNAKNPIIGNRSFGEDRENVTRKGIAFLQGMESVGVLGSGKHFPGHGDTATDSHKDLPFLDFSQERLDSIELYPFKKLIDTGISSIMVGHLSIPAMEPKAGFPSSLSKNIITDYLKTELNYKGLVLTDALNMQGVRKYAPEGEVELAAFMAGNDILLMPVDVASAHQKLTAAYQKGKISEARLEASVKKILKAKYKVGLANYKPVPLENLIADLNTIEDDLLYETSIENAITVVKNKFNLLPLRKLDNKKIAYVKFGDSDNTTYVNTLKKYAAVDVITAKDIAEYRDKIRHYNFVIIGLHRSNASPWKAHSFTENEKYWVQEIARMRTSNTVLTVFTKPYALLDVQDWEAMDGILVAYQNSKVAQEKAAEVLFGAIGAKGRLPVTAHPSFKVNTGITTKAIARLGFSRPERVGLSSTGLAQVDSLVQEGLDSLMFPGAQVLISRKGKVVYHKSFGKPTYDSKDSIHNNYLFDLASVTKILGTLPLVMKLEEEGKLKLDYTFQELIPAYAESELKDVTVLKALSHYGRLPAWIAFYLSTLDENRKPSDFYYRKTPSKDYATKVFDGLYLSNAYKDSIYNRIGRQELKSNKYRYSDVAYYVMKKYVEDTNKQRIDTLLTDFLLKPIGATHMAYNPLDQFPRDSIVPTEEDNYYRYKRVQGYVHDMGAAMQGGVGGHAGLFSNALDVAKIMQMYIQGGYYGGTRFFDARTIKKFNTCYFCDEDVRRGVGFDKPQLKNSGPTCGCVSKESFGHSGFTGTYTWADPEEEIVYVFLSNRTYPTMTNNLLVKSGLRTRIQQAIYDSIIN